MPKWTVLSEPQERRYKTNGFHLPASLWELLNHFVFERTRTKAGRAITSALVQKMIEKTRKAVNLETGETVH